MNTMMRQDDMKQDVVKERKDVDEIVQERREINGKGKK